MTFLTAFTTLVFLSTMSFADTAKVHCSMADHSDVAAATADLNASLQKLQVKSASAPVVTVDRLGYVSVCVTVTN